MPPRVNALFSSNSLQQWAYSMSRFNQYGLMRHDCMRNTPDVQEALRRLPQHVVDARNFRISRALQLDAIKKVLPQEQWTKLEEDVLYLEPYLSDIIKERKEKEAWDAE
ncbi:hypothetical protein KM043_007750 [Ampulex compressa]|nr:hypothetical protein KM043_007750 [Ampulex compressa]